MLVIWKLVHIRWKGLCTLIYRLNLYVKTPKHLFLPTIKSRRLERADTVFNYLKRYGPMVKIFSNKKIFTINAVLNHCNNWNIAKAHSKVKGIFRTKQLAQVIVFGVVVFDKKDMSLHFSKPGEEINTEICYKVLRYKVLVCLKINYPTGNYVWTQDGAPTHAAKKVQKIWNKNFKFLACKILAIVQSRPESHWLYNLGHIRALNQQYFIPLYFPSEESPGARMGEIVWWLNSRLLQCLKARCAGCDW